jgi:ribonuclease BN (tRNA processing enzyme)
MSKKSKRAMARRAFLAGLAATPALALPQGKSPDWWLPDLTHEEDQVKAQLKKATGTKLVLLGTGGGPSPGHIRHNTSHVIVHGDSAYVVDCGLGVTNQLARTGIPFRSVRSIFITHHHPDHNIELGPFLVIGWIYGLPQQVAAYGPPPLEQITRDFLASQQVPIKLWAEDFKIPPLEKIAAHDLPKAGAVMHDENVLVTSALVEHPPVAPAYAYRFDFPDRSIVFSGDTATCEAVAELARGADVLVHEALDLPALRRESKAQILAGSLNGGFRVASFDAFMHHIIADHTPTEEVGRIAQEAGVKTLVLSHLVPASIEIPDSAWRSAAARHFKGEIVVGHDLMVV